MGLGGKGNDGVTGVITQTDGSIGYIELAYATQNKLTFANMKNAAGTVVTASVDSTTRPSTITADKCLTRWLGQS